MNSSLGLRLLAPHAVWEEALRGLGLPFRTAPVEGPAEEPVRIVPPGPRPDARGLAAAGAGAWLVPESLAAGLSGLPGDVARYPDAWVRSDERRGGILKSFSFGRAEAREEVARDPKKPSRDALFAAIRGLFARHGLPLAALSYYPDGRRSAFCFRVDCDEYDADRFGRFFAAAGPYAGATSLFFCMASYEPHADEIRRCRGAGFDIHSHGYTHYTYRSYRQNLFNLRKADAALEKAGAARAGFCSPHGRWYPELQAAVDEMRYSFSSEFSYDYDGIPSYPVIGGRRCGVLQVPVHPVGLGVYMEASGRYDEADIEAYFRRVFEAKIECGEPVIFYDHPTTWLGVYPEWIARFFGMASAAGLWTGSMSEWAAWWKARHETRWTARLSGEAIEVETQAPREARDRLSVEIHGPDGRIASLRPAAAPGPVPLAGLPWGPGRPAYRGGFGRPPAGQNPALTAKRALKRWLDWETATPEPELIRDSLPSVLKSALRRATGPKLKRRAL